MTGFLEPWNLNYFQYPHDRYKTDTLYMDSDLF